MATNFSVKIGANRPIHLYCRPDIPKLIAISHYSSGDLVTSFKHLVNFGPVTPEFKRVKCVHPLSISSLATFALL